MAKNRQKTQKRKSRPRTYARNRAMYSRRGYEKMVESDGTYFLKLVICVLLGTFWVRFSTPIVWGGFVLTAIPLGLLIGLFLVNKYEGSQLDRKIWYVVLILVTIVSLWFPTGLVI